jgi:hypothetical protein
VARATGTPSTGTVVFAASMPGRCAAPPAPAMIALNPACVRGIGEREHLVGHPVRGQHLRVVATPRRSSTSTAFDIVGQSLLDPITTATTALLIAPVCPSDPQRRGP